MQGKLSVVVDGMFGSCGKGHLTADLTHQSRNDHVTCVRPGAHQAGHSAIGLDGKLYALRQVPIAAVVNRSACLFIAAGSEVCAETLLDEVHLLEDAGFGVSDRLLIDAAATWLQDKHIEQEGGSHLDTTGSTKKGVGAARSDRIWRTAHTVVDCPDLEPWVIPDTPRLLSNAIRSGSHLVIEGVQGYGLGLHTRFYPHTTSGDCRAIDFLASCGISPWERGVPTPEVWVVVRPYPIRIAGNSGPLKGETSWQELGLPTEITTVTKKPRRVGSWDPELVNEAVRANGGNVKIAFAMADQVIPHLAGKDGNLVDYWTDPKLVEWIERIESAAGDGSAVQWVGTGPNTALRLPDFVSSTAVVPSVDDSLERWWLDTSRHDFESVIIKATQYGSNSLEQMGHKLAHLQRNVVPNDHAQELACWFYACSKLERWTDAVMRSDRPQDDTLLDLEVYTKMARRIRESGGWPSG